MAENADPPERKSRGQNGDLAMFNLAIESKMRACDFVAPKVPECRRPAFEIGAVINNALRSAGLIKG